LLRECRSHGYYRGDEMCPMCGASNTRFLLKDEEIDSVGRTMAGVLRHFPERYGLEMDANGWVDLGEFITAVAIRNRRFRFLKPNHILGLIQTDPKGRYEFRDGRIRATYGHSLDVDLDLPTDSVPDVLFYPTSEEECTVLLGAGLRPSDRKMVHLSGTFLAALEAGRVRIQAPVILEIDTKAARDAGVVIKKAGKTVYLTKEMPPEFLKRSERVEEELSAEEAPPG
jgi:putative RNA 2'-phosphotransferase